jgi:hypothetical protein
VKAKATIALAFFSLTACGQSQKITHTHISYCREGFYEENSPLQYLRLLKKDFETDVDMVMVCPPPQDWVKREHIDSLLSLTYNADSVKCIVSIWSSTLPKGKFSSIGREAQSLIEFFRDGDGRKSYPITMTSFGSPDIVKAKELEDWWAELRNQDKLGG